MVEKINLPNHVNQDRIALALENIASGNSKAEVDMARVSMNGVVHDTLKERLDMTESELETVIDNTVATNILNNPDFEQGMTSWLANYMASSGVIGNEATFIGNSNLSEFAQTKSLTAGNKYYMRADIKSDSTSVKLALRRIESPWNTITSMPTKGSSAYEKISFVTPNLLATGTYKFRVVDERTSGWTPVTVKNHMLVNLTELFGFGNEPSAKEFEDLLAGASIDNGWFKGSERILSLKSLYDIIPSTGHINVKDFGATGDGETDDWGAIQSAIDYAYESGISSVFVPAGQYYLTKPLRTVNNSYWDNVGIEVFGVGLNTIFSRVKLSEVTYVRNNKATWFNPSTSNVDRASEAVFCVHSVKNSFRNFAIRYAKVGIFIGQDPTFTDATPDNERTWANFNRFNNIMIQFIGTGIMFRPGQGCYYNTFREIQIAEGNTGVDMSEPFFSTASFAHIVSNRNTFSNSEINKMFLGIYLTNGDTNVIDNVNFENIENWLDYYPSWYGSKPSVLVDGVSTAMHFGYSLNTVSNCAIEFCARDIYDNAYGNNYINNSIHLYEGKFKRGPNSKLGTFIGFGVDGMSDAFSNGGLIYQHENSTNMTGALFPDLPPWETIATRPLMLQMDMYDEGYKGSYLSATEITNRISPTPTAINPNDSVHYHKRIGGINYVWLRTYVQMAELDKDTPIKFTLPTAVNSELRKYAFRPPMKFTVIVGGEVKVAELVNGTGNEKLLKINPPTGGWNTVAVISSYTEIHLQMTYF